MSKYQIDCQYYIVFQNGEIVESSIDDGIVINDQKIIFSNSNPIQIHMIYLLDENQSMTVEYIVNERVQVDLIETRQLRDNAQFNRIIELKEDSVFNMFNENCSDNDENIDFNDHYTLSSNARCICGYAELSDGSLSSSVHYDLIGEGADVKMRMAALSKNQEKKAFEVTIQHLSPHTFGQMDNYGVTQDQGVLTIDGIGTITKGQYGSETHQNNKIIVFDEKCVAQANPYLYIDEYDVKASHAAAVGKVDEEHLFYLQSRGLNKKQAMRLITYGYLKPVSEIIDNELVQKRFEETLSKVGDERA